MRAWRDWPVPDDDDDPNHQPRRHNDSYDMIVQYASHQTIFIQSLQEHISRNAMRVRVLRNTDFVGGQVVRRRGSMSCALRRAD